MEGLRERKIRSPCWVTSDIQEALDDARVVLVSVPAFGARRMPESARRPFSDDHLVVCLPGAFGSLVVAQRTGFTLENLGLAGISGRRVEVLRLKRPDRSDGQVRG